MDKNGQRTSGFSPIRVGNAGIRQITFSGVCNPRIFHYNGASWTEMGAGAANQFESVYGRSNTDAFAVGIGGTILRYSISPIPCRGCVVNPVTIQGQNFPPGTDCECTATTSITIGPGVTIRSGAKTVFKAPKVFVKSGATFETGSEVTIQQE